MKAFTRKENDDTGEDDNAVSAREKIAPPSWLEKEIVSIDHIVEASAFIETPGQSRKGKTRRGPTTDDIACHGVLRDYRQLGKIIHHGRSSLPVFFFPEVGYLFVPWEGRFG